MQKECDAPDGAPFSDTRA